HEPRCPVALPGDQRLRRPQRGRPAKTGRGIISATGLRMLAALSLVAAAAVVPLLVAGLAPPSVFAPGAPSPPDFEQDLVRRAAAQPAEIAPPGVVAEPSPPVPSP